mmetsp:Transcript_83981/g.166768  ORF Transcript_83981/g.166768 Transcript_83981/m.166768 type:complete len:432 (-) Transcript_83981:95-1390(-)
MSLAKSEYFSRRATATGIAERREPDSDDELGRVVRAKSAPLFVLKGAQILRPSKLTVDCMTYQTPFLLTWKVFWLEGIRTAFAKPKTWWMMLSLTLIGLVVGTLPGLFMADPSNLRASKFSRIAVFLNSLVCFMIGFYFSMCVARWFSCVDGFMEIFDAIRNLQMQMHALGVPDEDKHRCVRYAVLSPWLLSEGLRVNGKQSLEEAEEHVKELWAGLVQYNEGLEEVDYDYLSVTTQEERLLREVDDPATVVWVWVASILGRLAQDGILPPAVCSTYGRILENVQAAQHGIEKVVCSAVVKVPYLYLNLLSMMVHINNAANAINFGIALGALVFSAVSINDESGFHPRPEPLEVFQDIENFVVVLFVNMFGPLLYLGLLDVSICIAEPFSHNETDIPVRRLLEILIQDLCDRSLMAAKTPSWEPPCFAKVK